MKRTKGEAMWEILTGLLVGTAVSGVLPLVSAELLVVAAAAAVPGLAVPLVAAVSAIGQMSAKTLLFSLARWAPAKLPVKARARIEKASEAVSERGGAASSIVFTSATLGFPPFYGVSLACGTLQMPLLPFILSGTAGRVVRFGVLAWAGHKFGVPAIALLAERGFASFLVGG